jgi:hypothetical protein
MSERIEFVGNPLPTGLPGFGGGTVSVLILPGFNTVVAVQQFGPVVDAPGVTVPDDTPPIGSDPEDPTDEVVNPGPAPGTPAGSNNFCEKCVPPDASASGNPLLFGVTRPSSCTNCAGTRVGTTVWFDTASNGTDGVFLYEGVGGLQGRNNSNWKLDSSQQRARLYLDNGEISFISGGGPSLEGPDGKEYKPQDLEVCEGGETKTWKVLAYKPD